MLRRATITIIAAAALLAPAAAHASKFPTVGMGDQTGSMFSDPRFANLGIRDVRFVVPYDVLTDPVQTARLDLWLAASRARHIRPLVAFAHSSRPGRLKHLPSVREYRRTWRAFHRRYPSVKLVSPWNEANHVSQPTARHPARAADYYNVVRADCRGCKIVAADVLDQSGLQRWLGTFRRHAHGKPRLWGLHNYGDANHFRSLRRSTTRKFLRYVSGEVWLTETGGVVRFGKGYKGGRKYERRAAKATKRVFALAAMSPRIKRVYLYHWQAPARFVTWDSGLVAPDGRLRPAYYTLRSELNAARRHAGRPRLAPIPAR
jgi:hypothetical protein